MEQIQDKSFWIDHAMIASEGYEEINHYVVWSPDRTHLLAEEFITIEDAKLWIDQESEVK